MTYYQSTLAARIVHLRKVLKSEEYLHMSKPEQRLVWRALACTRIDLALEGVIR